VEAEDVDLVLAVAVRGEGELTSVRGASGLGVAFDRCAVTLRCPLPSSFIKGFFRLSRQSR
jgi:hypothetical protein